MPPTTTPRDGKPDPKAKGAVLDPKAKKDGKPAQDDKSAVPPVDTFYTRYSPNGEAILSPLASTVLHCLFLGMILLGVGALFGRGDSAEEIEPVLIGDGDGPGGGGGHVLGTGDASGALSKPKDDVTDTVDPNAKVTQPTKDVPETDPTVKTTTGPTLADDPDAASFIEKVKQKSSSPNLGVFMKDALEGIAGKGRGGSGSGGGFGSGKGTGTGDGFGSGPTNKRGKRVLRWEMLFKTDNAADYLRQLNALGAYIGVPDKSGRLMIVKDLSERPARPVYEDIRSVNRIFWVDQRAESASSVAEIMQLDVKPEQFVAFIPISIEEALLKVEMDYAKPRGRKTEDDIAETKFNVSFRAGKPVFTVASQKGKR